MKNKLMMIMLLGLFLISFTSASLGTFKQNECVDIKTILNTSAVTIGSLNYPNSSKALGLTSMSKSGLTFNYTFCNTSTLGTYNYDYNDTEGDVYVNSFDITYNGDTLTTAGSILNLGFLSLLILLFLANLLGFLSIDSINKKNNEGDIIDVNNLKYLKGVLFAFGYALLIAVFFTASNIALAYLSTNMFGSLLFVIYRILMLLSLPIVVVWLIWLFVNIFQDKETRKLIERGANFGGDI